MKVLRVFATLLTLFSMISCGNGGGGSDSTTTSTSTKSNVFVRDMSTDTVASAINRNPAAGTLVIDRSIQGSNTLISSLCAQCSGEMYLDGASDRLYVANNNRILVFDSAGTANGNIAPSRTLTFGGTSDYRSLVLNSAQDTLYAVENNTGSIRVFTGASTASNASANRLISGFNGDVFTMHSMALDTTLNILYVLATRGGAAQSNLVLVFDNASTMNGVTAASRTIDVQSNVSASGLALDIGNNRLYVSSVAGVNVYNNASISNGAPVADKTINFPSQVFRLALDTANDRLYGLSGSSTYILNNVSTASGAVIAIQVTAVGSNLGAIAVR